MAITDYTTSTSVRAVLGVSDDEIENATIEDAVYSVLLDEALYTLGPTLAADYATVKAGSQTPTTTRFLNLVNTWAAYQVANTLLTSLPMFAPKEMKAEKDAATRVDDPYKDMQARLSEAMSMLSARLLALYPVLFPSQVVPDAVVQVNVVSVGLPSDPVTG